MATARTQPAAGPGDAVPLWVRRDWETAYLRVKGTAPALRLWDRVLTADDRRRLGDDLEAAYAKYRGAVGMWRQLHGVSVPRAVVAVGVRIGSLDADTGRALLCALGEESDDPADAVETAVASGGLVLVESPPQAFWDGTSIEVDWARHPSWWDLLWTLGRASKGRGAVDAFALRERGGGDPKFVTKRKHKLVNARGFPLTLADLVESAGRGTYRLALPPERIRVFERGAGDGVREWTP